MGAYIFVVRTPNVTTERIAGVAVKSNRNKLVEKKQE
jgi:hypothetical protein